MRQYDAPRRVALVAAAMAITLLAVACSGQETPSGPGGDAGPQPQTSAPAADAAAPPPTAAGEARPVASREVAGANGIPMEVAVTELRRSGDLLVLSFTVSNLSEDQQLEIFEMFEDGVEQGESFYAGGGRTVDGVFLVDPVNRKRHLVARDTENRCVCSGDLLKVKVAPGQSTTLSATFGAPPQNVRTMDVTIPQAGTFSNVPLS
jgi:hypothetical protein